MSGRFILEQTLDELYGLARTAVAGSDRRLRESRFRLMIDEVNDKQGVGARADLLREVLGKLLHDHEQEIDYLNYPEEVRKNFHEEFARIRKHLQESEDEHFDLDRQLTRCDFRIAMFARVPTGLEHLDPGGLPRSLLSTGGYDQGVKFLKLLTQTRGVKPFYELHFSMGSEASLKFFRRFNDKARRIIYKNAAGCLEMHPEVRGLMGASWWFDPALAEISPGLFKLGQIMLEEGGATLLRAESDEDAIHDALHNSAPRKKLYDEGKYTPCTYYVVWPREDVINWARQN